MKSSVLVVGSSNTDMVIKADHLPSPGETILGGTFFMNAGGKGANQAVAAARLEGNVTFICKTGDDIFGRQAMQTFKDEGIDVSYSLVDPAIPSGVALISVDKNAENCIVVASGANARLNPEDLHSARQLIEQSSVILMQLEIPLTTVEYVASIASAKGKMVILNPAPACQLSGSLLSQIFLITPNQKEAEMLSGIKVTDINTAKSAAAAIRDKGVKNVIITLGPDGALILNEGIYTHIPSVKVNAIDTTAAGDVFNGALAVALAELKSIEAATEFACRAAAIAVTRLGAQASAPYRKEISQVLIDSE